MSGFVVRPPEARSKPRVSSFLDANFERILELKPDLVLGFSDLQADIGRELCKRGVPVHLFNQRTCREILQSVRLTGALVGRAEDGGDARDAAGHESRERTRRRRSLRCPGGRACSSRSGTSR